ncbi:A2ML1 protein, partial [Rhynochetos jubatus]|nr:A2ML1 protein [Rhynochetos jubatus]
KRCNIVYEIATITFENTDKFYKPGIPDTGTVLLKGTNVSALKEEFLLMVNDSGEIQNKTLPIDESGQASFELDTSGWNDKVSLHGELKDYQPASEPKGNEHLNHRSVTRSLHPFSSDHKSFLRIHKVKRKLPCGQPQRILVDYSFDENAKGIKQQSLDVVILVLAKGTTATVLRRELPQEAGLRGSFSLELHIGPELAPTAKVLGYTVLTNGEMVADSTELKVAKCFPNKVTLSLEQRAPVGSELRLKVQASPGSLCAIYTVDQHTQSSGPQGKLSPSTVSLDPGTTAFHSDGYKLCSSHHQSGIGANSLDCPGIPLLPGGVCLPLTVNAGAGAVWEWSCQSRSTRPFPTVPGAAASLGTDTPLVMALFAGAELEEDEGVMQDTETKTYFLGTWLWDLVPVGDGGSAELRVTVPDTITEWEAGMFCTAPQGLGLAPATTLMAFKPFSVELVLPYAVVRHEAFTLAATVFNYLQQCLRVQVMLVELAELEVSGGEDGVHRDCVCANEERTFQWAVRTSSLGEVNITIIAKALHSEKLCGTEMSMVPAHGHVDTDTELLTVQVS